MKNSSLRSALFFLCAGVASAAELKIEQAAIERYADGPAVYRSESFTAGEVVHFSFFAGGATRKGDAVSVSFEAEAKDPGGLLLTPRITGEEKSTLSPEDKDWKPKLRGSFALPGILLPGEYSIAVQLKDALAGTTTTAVLPFLVSGPRVQPAAALSIQNLGFYRNDTDEKALETAAYRGNEEVHVRFLVLGFKHDEKGAIRVTYGIALADASGHKLFENPSAAADEGAELYPKPYVPGMLSFTLKPGTPPGEYTLTVTARDFIGSQQTEVRRAFRLE